MAATLRTLASEIARLSSSRLAASSAGAELATFSSASEVSLRSTNSALRFSAVSKRCRQPLISLVTSWLRFRRASPSRRTSSWRERNEIIVIRAASTVTRRSSTAARSASKSPKSAKARSASRTRVRAPIASSSWRFTANPRDSKRPSAKLRSASDRLNARPASATMRSASRRASRAARSASLNSANRVVSVSCAPRAPSARLDACSSDCFNSSRRFSCCRRNAAALGASSAHARNPSHRHKSPSRETNR